MLLNYRHVFLRIAGNRTNSVVVFFQQKIAGHLAFCNLTQGNNGRLVILFRNHRLGTLGGDLAGAFGGQHDQLESVIYVFQTIFNGNSCHNFPDS